MNRRARTPAPSPDAAASPRRRPKLTAATDSGPRRIFLLSPANLAGVRGKWLLGGQSPMSLRLRDGGVPVGELFAYISGLYFRGKLAYAQAFARGSKKVPGAFVITSCLGLLPLDQALTSDHVRAIAGVPVHAAEPRYRLPLERDARALARRIGRDCEVVLLGSIATAKYAEPLAAVFGERLLVPADFVGRGDMSRGGLMLRCVRAGLELEYRSLSRLPEAARHGTRPPKLSASLGTPL